MAYSGTYGSKTHFFGAGSRRGQPIRVHGIPGVHIKATTLASALHISHSKIREPLSHSESAKGPVWLSNSFIKKFAACISTPFFHAKD